VRAGEPNHSTKSDLPKTTRNASSDATRCRRGDAQG
jgi:hypothetical protein